MPGGYPVAPGARRHRLHAEGYEVVESDPAALGRVAEQMKQTMGPAFRDWDGRVPIAVGSTDGRLHQAPDGGYRAGACAMLMLVADREKWVRDTAVLVKNDSY